MPILRCQVRIPSDTAIPADLAINTWHFTATDDDEGTLTLIKAALVDFYEALDGYKSNRFFWQNTRIKIYNLDDPEPRNPVDDVGLALTSPPTGNALPRELAVCLSFQAAMVSGSPPARRRGRIFFGPLHANTLATNGEISPTVVSQVAFAGGTLLTASNTASDWAWVVYSRTAGQAFPVVEGWCDNEFDVQRRRQIASTARTTF